MADLKQSTATTRMVFMTDSTDRVTGKTGLNLTITASKAGGAFALITPTVVDRGSGWYSLALTAQQTDTLGDLVLHITATGADPSDVKHNVVAGSLDADISSRLAPTMAGRTLDVSATGEAGIDLANVGNPTTKLNLSGTTVAGLTGDVAGKVLGGGSSTIIGTGVNASISAVDASLTADGTARSGSASTITLASSASAYDDAYNGRTIDLVAGTGAGQSRKIVDYAGPSKVATVDVAWVINPDSTSRYAMGTYAPEAMASLGSTAPDGWLSAASVSSAAVSKIQAGLSTFADGNVTVGGYAKGQDPASLTASSFSSIISGLSTIAGYIDTEVGAIKAKTDCLPAAFPANFPSLSIEAGSGKVVTSNPASGGSAITDSSVASAVAKTLAEAHGAGAWTASATVTLADASLTASKLAPGIKFPATVAAGDDADASAIKATIGTSGAGLTAVPYVGPTVSVIASAVLAAAVESGMSIQQVLSHLWATLVGASDTTSVVGSAIFRKKDGTESHRQTVNRTTGERGQATIAGG